MHTWMPVTCGPVVKCVSTTGTRRLDACLCMILDFSVHPGRLGFRDPGGSLSGSRPLHRHHLPYAPLSPPFAPHRGHSSTTDDIGPLLR